VRKKVLSVCGGIVGRVANRLSGSSTDERRCSARVRRAEPCVWRGTALRAMLVARHEDPAVGVGCRAWVPSDTWAQGSRRDDRAARCSARVHAAGCSKLTSSDMSEHVCKGAGQMRRHTARFKLVMCVR
jgi:hypothetical protein